MAQFGLLVTYFILTVMWLPFAEGYVNNGDPCYRECYWSEWNPWSSCSYSCGGGTRERSRLMCCRDSVYSESCYGCGKSPSDFTETRSCNTFCTRGEYIDGTCVCPPQYEGLCCDVEQTSNPGPSYLSLIILAAVVIGVLKFSLIGFVIYRRTVRIRRAAALYRGLVNETATPANVSDPNRCYTITNPSNYNHGLYDQQYNQQQEGSDGKANAASQDPTAGPPSSPHQ